MKEPRSCLNLFGLPWIPRACTGRTAPAPRHFRPRQPPPYSPGLTKGLKSRNRPYNVLYYAKSLFCSLNLPVCSLNPSICSLNPIICGLNLSRGSLNQTVCCINPSLKPTSDFMQPKTVCVQTKSVWMQLNSVCMQSKPLNTALLRMQPKSVRAAWIRLFAA